MATQTDSNQERWRYLVRHATYQTTHKRQNTSYYAYRRHGFWFSNYFVRVSYSTTKRKCLLSRRYYNGTSTGRRDSLHVQDCFRPYSGLFRTHYVTGERRISPFLMDRFHVRYQDSNSWYSFYETQQEPSRHGTLT